MFSWDWNTKDSNGKLAMRGKRWWSQISNWRSKSGARKMRKTREKKSLFLSWLEGEVAGNKIWNVGGRMKEMTLKSNGFVGPIDFKTCDD